MDIDFLKELVFIFKLFIFIIESHNHILPFKDVHIIIIKNEYPLLFIKKIQFHFFLYYLILYGLIYQSFQFLFFNKLIEIYSHIFLLFRQSHYLCINF